MRDIHTWLELADPLKHESPLADADLQRMRRTIITAAHEPAVRPTLWWGHWIAAAVAVAVLVIVSTYRSGRAPLGVARDDAGASIATEPPVTTPRQLEFVTPGGTRVIWYFNPDFEVKGSRR
jgi:hypothetical protein